MSPPSKRLGRVVSLPAGDLPVLAALAHDLQVESHRELLRGLAHGTLILTAASKPPPYRVDTALSIRLEDEEVRALKRLCSAYELFNFHRKPSIGTLLHALAVGSAVAERWETPVA